MLKEVIYKKPTVKSRQWKQTFYVLCLKKTKQIQKQNNNIATQNLVFDRNIRDLGERLENQEGCQGCKR